MGLSRARVRFIEGPGKDQTQPHEVGTVPGRSARYSKGESGTKRWHQNNRTEQHQGRAVGSRRGASQGR